MTVAKFFLVCLVSLCHVLVPLWAQSFLSSDEVERSAMEIIRMRGFKSAEYKLKTDDGYILNLVRLINPLIVGGVSLKRPVLFVHGFAGSSTVWVAESWDVRPLPYPRTRGSGLEEIGNLTNFRRHAAFMLANEGYDVFLADLRGNEYSQGHINLNSSHDMAYWEFQIDQQALIDLPVTIQFIMELTRAPKVACVAHGQGGFDILALLASRPIYSQLVEPVILLGPQILVHNIRSKPTELILRSAWFYERTVGPFPPGARTMRMGSYEICRAAPKSFLSTLCRVWQSLLSGIETKPVQHGQYHHFPYTTSLGCLKQYAQIYRDRRWQMFDYGRTKNLRLYGSEQPVEYNAGLINSSSLVLISSKFDSFNSEANVQDFIRQLTVPLFRKLEIDFVVLNSMDLVMSEWSASAINTPILEIMEHFHELDPLAAQLTHQGILGSPDVSYDESWSDLTGQESGVSGGQRHGYPAERYKSARESDVEITVEKTIEKYRKKVRDETSLEINGMQSVDSSSSSSSPPHHSNLNY